MGCCGGKRAELRNQTAAAAAPVQPARTVRREQRGHRLTASKPATATAVRQRIPETGPVTLRYLGTASILIVGPVTGRQYRFSTSQAAQRVARADATRLLSTGLFKV